jgi:polyisoprenoid-binding protein YceI
MAIEKWDFDLVHSSINFWVRHLMVSKVHGRFTKWTGFIELDEANPGASRTEVEIDAASIDTKEPQRDGHLRSADFLDVEKYPNITFRSTGVETAGDKRYRVKGDLTIRGVTRPVVLDVEYAGRVKDPWGGERVGFTAKTSIDRKDFGLTWNQTLDAGGVVVGDKVEIDIEIEATKAKAA